MSEDVDPKSSAREAPAPVASSNVDDVIRVGRSSSSDLRAVRAEMNTNVNMFYRICLIRVVAPWSAMSHTSRSAAFSRASRNTTSNSMLRARFLQNHTIMAKHESKKDVVLICMYTFFIVCTHLCSLSYRQLYTILTTSCWRITSWI